MASPVLGIDLGTTNSVVAHADEARVRVLRDENGRLLCPSTVSFMPNGETAVGHAARDLRLIDAENTVFSIKRLIGRPFRSSEVKRAAARLPFKLEEGPTGGVVVRARNETFSLPEVSSYILRHLRAVAERALEQRCVNAVITVPANFNELQRMATRDAGRIAGLNVLRILNEPTAAALAYGYRAQQQQRIAVYDFGGGTFDISILELSGDVIEVIATAGDTHLGGDDIDRALADQMVAEFERKHGLDLKQAPQQYERIAMAAEWLKCQLSERDAAEATIKHVAEAGGESIDLKFRCGRAELDALSTPLIQRTFSICEDALRLAGIRPTQLDGVILVGGQTRTPRVRALVAEYFGTQPKYSVDPDLAVAQGAALQGYALSGVPAADPDRRVVRTLAGPASVPPEPNPFEDEPTRVAFAEDEPHVEVSNPFDDDMPTTISKRELAPPPALASGLPSLKPEGLGKHSSTLSGVGDPDAPLPASKWPSAGPLLNPGDTEPVSPFRTNAERPSARASFGKSKVPPPPPIKLPPARTTPPAAIGGEAWEGDSDLPAVLRPESVAPPPAAATLTESPKAKAKARESMPAAPPLEARADSARRPTTGSNVVQPSSPPDASLRETPAPPQRQSAAPKAVPPPPPPKKKRPESIAPGQRPSWSPVQLSGAVANDRAPAPARRRPTPVPPQDEAEISSQFPGPPAVAPLLLDVTPHSLCVETVDGFCEQIIERNAPIPTEQTRIFSTSRDNQLTVSVRVCQGESRRIEDNEVLGQIDLLDLRPARRGEVSIAVTFVLDVDGTLNIRAIDEGTGHGQELQLNLVGAIATSEIDRMRGRQRAMTG